MSSISKTGKNRNKGSECRDDESEVGILKSHKVEHKEGTGWIERTIHVDVHHHAGAANNAV